MAHNLLIFKLSFMLLNTWDKEYRKLKNRQMTLFLFSFFFFFFALHYLNTYANDNNFIKCLALKAFIIYYDIRCKQFYKSCNYDHYYYCYFCEIYFLLAYFYFECNLNNPEWYRSSRLQMFFKIGVLKIFSIFTGKHLC